MDLAGTSAERDLGDGRSQPVVQPDRTSAPPDRTSSGSDRETDRAYHGLNLLAMAQELEVMRGKLADSERRVEELTNNQSRDDDRQAEEARWKQAHPTERTRVWLEQQEAAQCEVTEEDLIGWHARLPRRKTEEEMQGGRKVRDGWPESCCWPELRNINGGGSVSGTQ